MFTLKITKNKKKKYTNSLEKKKIEKNHTKKRVMGKTEKCLILLITVKQLGGK